MLELVADPELEGMMDFRVAEEATVEKEPIYWMVLTNKARSHTLNYTSGEAPSRVEKPKIFITFGEHAREFVTTESFFDLFFNITKGWKMPCHTPEGHYSRLLPQSIELVLSCLDPCFACRFVLDNFELYLVPLMNPDGKNRLERTNDYCHRNNGRGVDLNRNADWEYNGPGSSKTPGSEEYIPFVCYCRNIFHLVLPF